LEYCKISPIFVAAKSALRFITDITYGAFHSPVLYGFRCLAVGSDVAMSLYNKA